MTEHEEGITGAPRVAGQHPQPEVRRVRIWTAFFSFISQPKYIGTILVILFVIINLLYFIGYSVILTLMVADAEFAVASIALLGIIQRSSSSSR